MANTMTVSNPVPNIAGVDSADLTTPVVAEIVSTILDRFKPQLRAIVLTGSMARGEGTFVRVPGGWDAQGDCEAVLVFNSHERLPSVSTVADLQREIELRLERRCIACPVGLGPVHPGYFVNLRPHIYGYELRRCGRVLWGDPDVLALIPAFSPSDIPLEDAWRIVCNRMIESLLVAEECNQAEHTFPSRAEYKATKLCLDLATSFLLFCGEYAPTYQERSAQLQRLSERLPTPDGLPFPLPPFAALVQRLTRRKISPASGVHDREPFLIPRIWGYARRLWRWELLRLVGGGEDLSDSCLMRRWMRSQPLRRRIRGWASLTRKYGWFKSWQEWPRWVRLGMSSSPRYWIYAAGSELFFQLPSLMEQGECISPTLILERWRQWLPVRPKQAVTRNLSWRQLASEITWNYQQFLMETSA
jgi:hypothetical protein